MPQYRITERRVIVQERTSVVTADTGVDAWSGSSHFDFTVSDWETVPHDLEWMGVIAVGIR